MANPVLFHKDYRKMKPVEDAGAEKDDSSSKSVNSADLGRSDDNETMFELNLEEKKENHYFYDITALLREPVNLI